MKIEDGIQKRKKELYSKKETYKSIQNEIEQLKEQINKLNKKRMNCQNNVLL